MFQNILVPVDFSTKTQEALQVAIMLAQQHHSKINLLHVIETIADASFEEFSEFYMQLENRTRRKMDELVEGYHQQPIHLEERIVYGNRVQAILDFIELHNIDLVVMRSHQVNLEDPGTNWGTISYKVGVLAPCPVMLVK